MSPELTMFMAMLGFIPPFMLGAYLQKEGVVDSWLFYTDDGQENIPDGATVEGSVTVWVGNPGDKGVLEIRKPNVLGRCYGYSTEYRVQVDVPYPSDDVPLLPPQEILVVTTEEVK